MSTNDPEIEAINQVSVALTDLDDDARARVVAWAINRFTVDLGPGTRGPKLGPREDDPNGGADDEPVTGEDVFPVFADLFHATNPRTDAERALVGGYWFQEVGGDADFQGLPVNNALKDVGHGVSNITDALGSLQKRRPALVGQVAKSGRSKQARKRYKLTTAGVEAVKGMLGNEGPSE